MIIESLEESAKMQETNERDGSLEESAKMQGNGERDVSLEEGAEDHISGAVS